MSLLSTVIWPCSWALFMQAVVNALVYLHGVCLHFLVHSLWNVMKCIILFHVVLVGNIIMWNNCTSYIWLQMVEYDVENLCKHLCLIAAFNFFYYFLFLCIDWLHSAHVRCNKLFAYDWLVSTWTDLDDVLFESDVVCNIHEPLFCSEKMLHHESMPHRFLAKLLPEILIAWDWWLSLKHLILWYQFQILLQNWQDRSCTLTFFDNRSYCLLSLQ